MTKRVLNYIFDTITLALITVEILNQTIQVSTNFITACIFQFFFLFCDIDTYKIVENWNLSFQKNI